MCIPLFVSQDTLLKYDEGILILNQKILNKQENWLNLLFIIVFQKISNSLFHKKLIFHNKNRIVSHKK